MNPNADPQAAQTKQAMQQLMVQGKHAEVQRTVADTALKNADTALRQKDLGLRGAQTTKTQADAAKSFSESQQVHLENEIMIKHPPTHNEMVT